MHARARVRHFLRLRGGAHGRRPTDRSMSKHKGRATRSRGSCGPRPSRAARSSDPLLSTVHTRCEFLQCVVPTTPPTPWGVPHHKLRPHSIALRITHQTQRHSVADHTPDAAAHFQLYNVPRCPSPLGRAGGHSECPQSRVFTPVPACMPCACMPYVPACPLPATVRSPPPARPRPTRRCEGEAVHFGWNSYSRV